MKYVVIKKFEVIGNYGDIYIKSIKKIFNDIDTALAFSKQNKKCTVLRANIYSIGNDKLPNNVYNKIIDYTKEIKKEYN